MYEIQEKRRDRPISPERAAREDRIRERIRTEVTANGLDRVANGLAAYARVNGMRTWAGRNREQQARGARSSCEILLRLKAVSTDNRFSTGHCVGWVLDIMEGYLNDLTEQRERLFGGRANGRAPSTEVALIAEPVIEPGPEKPESQSLSAQLLDAYLSRDDEAIMRIAVAVEALERECG